MNILIILFILFGLGVLVYTYYTFGNNEIDTYVDETEYDEDSPQCSEGLSMCNLGPINGADCTRCLDDPLVDPEAQKEFSNKILREHQDYLEANSSFLQYVTNQDAVIKSDPSVCPFRHPDHYKGQTLQDIYNQQLTTYEARSE